MDKKTALKLARDVVEDYNNISKEFDQTRQHDWKEFNEFLPYIKDNQALADIGCGNGRFFSFIKDKRDIRYLGIDISDHLLEKAISTFKEAKFKIGDILDIPSNKEKFDVVLSIAVIHHIPSKELREKAIKELHRILKKNSTLIITAWNLFQQKYKKYIWKSYVKHILSLRKYDLRDTFIPWGKSGINRYYHAFTQKELKKLLEKYFDIIKETKGNNFVFICKKK